LAGAIYALIALALCSLQSVAHDQKIRAGEWIMFGSLLASTGPHALPRLGWRSAVWLRRLAVLGVGSMRIL